MRFAQVEITFEYNLRKTNFECKKIYERSSVCQYLLLKKKMKRIGWVELQSELGQILNTFFNR